MKSKFYPFLIILLLISPRIFSQEVQKYDKDRNYFFIGPGMNWNSFNHKGLDFVIDRFNTTRKVAPSEKMGKIHSMLGYNAGFGWVSNKYNNGLFYSFSYQHSSGTASAKGIALVDTLIMSSQGRDLKASLTNITMGMGFMPIQTPVMDIGLGGQFNMDFLGFETRTFSENYNKINNDFGSLGFGGSFYLLFNFFLFKGFPLCLTAQPYYFFDFLPSSMSGLNEELNPGTYTLDSDKDQLGLMSHFGLQVQANLCIFARKQQGSQKHNKDKKKNKRQTKGFSLME